MAHYYKDIVFSWAYIINYDGSSIVLQEEAFPPGCNLIVCMIGTVAILQERGGSSTQTVARKTR